MMIAERIGEVLTRAISAAIGMEVTLYYQEAESDVMPYVVYDYTANPRYTKEGITSYYGYAQIVTVADNYHDMHALATAITKAIVNLNGSEGVSTSLGPIKDSCEEGIWRNDLTINILQK